MKIIAQSCVAMTLLTGSTFATDLLEEKQDSNARVWVISALKEIRAELKSMREEFKLVQHDHQSASSTLQTAKMTPHEQLKAEANLREMITAEKFLHETIVEYRAHEKKLKKYKKCLDQAAAEGSPVDQEQLSNITTYLQHNALLDENAPKSEKGGSSWLVQGIKGIENLLRHPVATSGLMLSAQIAGATAWRGPQCSPYESGTLNRCTITPVEEYTFGQAYNATLIQFYDVSYAADTSPRLAFNHFCPITLQPPQEIYKFLLSQARSPVSSIWSYSALEDKTLSYTQAKRDYDRSFHQIFPAVSPKCGKIPVNVSVTDTEPCAAAGFTAPYFSAGGENRCQVLYHCPVPRNLRAWIFDYELPCAALTENQGRSDSRNDKCHRTVTPAGLDEKGTPVCKITSQCPSPFHRIHIRIDFYDRFVNSVPTLLRQARDELVARSEWMQDHGSKGMPLSN